MRKSKVYLWDLKEDIGYVDEVDVVIVKILHYSFMSIDLALGA